ncbi:MAG: hypothetical protein CENE_01700 [Candidatus Celerinatantimonas neptuna]|nr:MAG: hypothetical protein CENE_01700 [Candidatus Celerinatantimonas neptuna]
MRTETVSYLKKNAADLPVDETLVITQNGVPKYVVESYEEKERRDNALALMKLVMFAKQDIANERVGTLDSLRTRLSERKQIVSANTNESRKTR